MYTRENAQVFPDLYKQAVLKTSLITSCRQYAFAVLVLSCWNKTVARLTTKGCKNFIISMLLLGQPCYKYDNHVKLLQVVNSLFQTWDKQRKDNLSSVSRCAINGKKLPVNFGR